MTTTNPARDAQPCGVCGGRRDLPAHRSSLHPAFHLFKARKPGVALTYNDSKNPGTIVVTVEDERNIARLTMTPAEAVELAFRLLNATQAEGYDLTARKAARR